LTTVAFLMIGVREGNPIVQFAIESAPSPIVGLALVKVAALGLGVYCLYLKKQQLLARINILFAAVVAWNLLALIVGAARTAA
jgi:hypothetical protein